MEFEIGYIIAGLAVGFIVGMTGVGGGSLMTPILLYFNVPATTAVGTDLLYAAITKAGGVVAHQKQKNIDWRIAWILAAGSIPASLVTLLGMHYIGFSSGSVDSLIRTTLGAMLIFTAAVIIFKQTLLDYSHKRDFVLTRLPERTRDIATVITGVVLGVVVTVTSIGAGALGTMALFMLYPLLATSRLVGTEIAHAVPLTLIAGLGHAGFGNVNWELLGNLLIGSLPGIYVGSHLTGAIPDKALRPALALMLVYAGGKLVMS
ncbi:MAG TPA: sulfite exporter TauE/SafE family protein [Dongiaceae bacterium]|nr:sulfite exporter TauE/SafE family protein [Dongiaceae bacterium]